MDYSEVISNVKIYDLKESLIASGYPMSTSLSERELNDKDLTRASRLAQLIEKDNPAHGQFLSGIIVNFDLTLTNKAWVEAERYRFLTFVSSQSTMHRITSFNLDNQYIEYTDPRIIEIIKEKVQEYNRLKDAGAEDAARIKYLEILYSNPAGFRLTARMTTNYRCLRNIYIQRHDHRLPEWRVLCEWIRTLPYAEELLIKEKKENEKT